MNLNRSRSTPPRSLAVSRAQFSPLARRVSPAAFTRRSAATPLALDQLWNPRLLDRWQPALTRYHD